MKKEIMGYITALIDIYQHPYLTDLWHFADDFEEEASSDGESIYVKKIVELEAENEELKKLKCMENTRLNNRLHSQLALNISLNNENKEFRKRITNFAYENEELRNREDI